MDSMAMYRDRMERCETTSRCSSYIRLDRRLLWTFWCRRCFDLTFLRSGDLRSQTDKDSEHHWKLDWLRSLETCSDGMAAEATCDLMDRTRPASSQPRWIETNSKQSHLIASDWLACLWCRKFAELMSSCSSAVWVDLLESSFLRSQLEQHSKGRFRPNLPSLGYRKSTDEIDQTKALHCRCSKDLNRSWRQPAVKFQWSSKGFRVHIHRTGIAQQQIFQLLRRILQMRWREH